MAESQSQPYVGIDICKKQLDVAVGQDGEFWTLENSAAAIRELIERLQPSSQR